MEDPLASTGGVASWLELLHAESCWVLAGRGVDALVIKGPTLSTWLYRSEARDSVDVDLLIRPAHWTRAIGALRERGFVDSLEDLRAGEVPRHSVTFTRRHPSAGQHSIDLHRYFPGMEARPDVAFEALWESRVLATQAAVPVLYPDFVARTLIVLLHYARDPRSSKTAEDVRRAWAALRPDDHVRVRGLAAQLDALPAMRAGLEALPELAPAVEELGLSSVEIPPDWVLLSQAASGTAMHLYEVGLQPWWRRPVTAVRWAFPSPGIVRIHDARASAGGVQLALGYVRRLRAGLRELPRAIREVRQAKRNT